MSWVNFDIFWYIKIQLISWYILFTELDYLAFEKVMDNLKSEILWNLDQYPNLSSFQSFIQMSCSFAWKYFNLFSRDLQFDLNFWYFWIFLPLLPQKLTKKSKLINNMQISLQFEWDSKNGFVVPWGPLRWSFIPNFSLIAQKWWRWYDFL